MNGSAVNSSPTWLTYKSTAQKFTYDIPSDITQVGTYTIIVTAAQNSSSAEF
jgi:hypothetical protein